MRPHMSIRARFAVFTAVAFTLTAFIRFTRLPGGSISQQLVFFDGVAALAPPVISPNLATSLS
jgi:hypothetical protein